MMYWPLSSIARKEVQGPDTTWRRIQGPLPWSCWRCMDAICTLCSVSQKQVITEIEGWVSPPIRATRAEPPPTPFKYTLLPQPRYQWRQASEKTHFSLWFEVRGHGLGKRRMWRPFWSFQHFSRRSDSRASDQRRLTSPLLSSRMRNPWQASTTEQVHGRPVQDRSLYKESPCTFSSSLSYNTRRRPHHTDHTDCCDDLQAK